MSDRLLHLSSYLAGQRNEVGATATEYGLLVGFIAFAILAGVGAFGTALDGVFESFATWLSATI